MKLKDNDMTPVQFYGIACLMAWSLGVAYSITQQDIEPQMPKLLDKSEVLMVVLFMYVLPIVGIILVTRT